MFKKFFFIGVAALLSASLFMLGCPAWLESVSEPEPEPEPEPKPEPKPIQDDPHSAALELAADLNAAAGGGNKATVDADGITVTLGDDVSISTSITVPAGVTLVVAAEKTLTVDSTGSIVLKGSETPARATLVVSAKIAGGYSAIFGGGKLVLQNPTAVQLGDIHVPHTAPDIALTATGTGTGNEFAFAGNEDETGIANLSTTSQGFKSIEASTIRFTDPQKHTASVTFRAGSSDATINKDTTLKYNE
jgi:hypothetical protein